MTAEEQSQDDVQKQYMQARQLELQKRMLLKQFCTSQAYERLMNVRLSAPELYDQLVSILAYSAKGGQLKGKITEEQVIQLLNKLRGPKREPTITIKRGK